MATTTAEGPTVSAPGQVPKPVTGELKGMDLAERKFARKLILPGLIAAILITQVPFLVTIYYSLQDFYADANGYLANPNRTTSPVGLRFFKQSRYTGQYCG